MQIVNLCFIFWSSPIFLEVPEGKLDVGRGFILFWAQGSFADLFKDSLYAISRGIIAKVRDSKYSLSHVHCMRGKAVSGLTNGFVVYQKKEIKPSSHIVFDESV